ncbi:MAG: hypothetical protein H0U27_08185 [Nitrosopumilus sp.]|nr:hypothetical protein [Nitrosopumilus sp.]
MSTYQCGNTPIISTLIDLQEDLANAFLSEMLLKKSDFISALRTRIDKEEEIEHITIEIKKTRESLEKDPINDVYNAFTNTLSDYLSVGMIHQNSVDEIKNMFSNEKTFDCKEFITLINYTLLSESQIKEEDIAKIITRLEKNDSKSIAIVKVLQSNNPSKTLLCALFYIHYQNEYLHFLIDKLKDLKESEVQPSLQNEIETKGSNKEFTTARQVLAIHYLMEELNVFAKADKTEVARFIQFLTGKETGVSKINDTTIYKKVKSPFSKNDKQLESDLRFIRIYFEKLGLISITDKINKEINSKE